MRASRWSPHRAVAERRGRGPPAGGPSCRGQLGRRRDLVGHGPDRRAHARPSASGVPRRSSSGAIPETPIATSTMPQRHGRPNESDTITARSTPVRSRVAARIRPADASGSTGRRVTTMPLAGPTLLASIPPFAQTNPCGGLGDDHPVRHAHDAAGLAQDHLDLARVAVPALGERDRLGARLDGRQVDDRALGLRDDLLGHDEHVVGTERPGAGSAASAESPGQEGREVVARSDLGDPVERDDLDPVRRLSRHGPGRACRAPRPGSGPRAGRDRARAARPARRPRPRPHRPRRGGRPGSPDRRRTRSRPAALTRSAFVPRPWRSATIATRGRRRPGRRPPRR